MTINPIKKNMTELDLGTWKVLFSYRTPVACKNMETGEEFYTTTKWSQTTTRHMNQWLSQDEPTPAPQKFFDNLIVEAR